MSTYQIAMHFSSPVRSPRLRALGGILMKWWVGLYAEPPRNLRLMI